MRKYVYTARNTFWINIIYIVSVAISLTVAFLILGPRPEGIEGLIDVSFLPLVNASLNGITALLLVVGVMLIKLNKITNDIEALVLAKVEYFNPGNSVKDRMAVKMVEDAEKDGRLKSGGTIVEGTSGNTGMGLALAAIVKGYRLICVTTDKQSKEKVDVLKAVGARSFAYSSICLGSMPCSTSFLVTVIPDFL